MPPRLQVVGQYVQAVAPAGIGAQAPLTHRLAQSLVCKQLAHHLCSLRTLGGVGFVHAQTRPKHHTARLRLATGHTQTKRIDLPTRGRTLRLRSRRQPRRQSCSQRDAVQIAAQPWRVGFGHDGQRLQRVWGMVRGRFSLFNKKSRTHHG